MFVYVCLPRELLLGTARYVNNVDQHNAVFVQNEEEGCLQVVVRKKTPFHQNAFNIISCQAIKDIKKGEEIGVPNKQDLSSDLSRTDR